MRRAIVPLIEAIAFTVCVVFGIFWLREPSGPYEPIVAFSGLTFVATEAWRRYRPAKKDPQPISEHVRVDIEEANVFVARFLYKENAHFNSFGVGFYVLNVINLSDKSITIKNVELQYELDGQAHKEEAYTLITGIVGSPHDGQERRAIILESHIQRVLIGWNNIRSVISKLIPLVPGGVLNGSAYFVFPGTDLQKLFEIRNASFVVTDHAGRTSAHPIQLKDEWIRQGEGVFIRPRQFSTDSKGNLIEA